MNERDERLAKEAMKYLITPAPESLKAELKRMARNRKPRLSPWEKLTGFFGGESAWAYGAGAAFAAAAVAVVIVKAVPERVKPAETVAAVAPAPAELADLWADDDGGDHD